MNIELEIAVFDPDHGNEPAAWRQWNSAPALRSITCPEVLMTRLCAGAFLAVTRAVRTGDSRSMYLVWFATQGDQRTV
jgi:hypothetical protein